MVRFSCFHTHIHCHRSKKAVQQYDGGKYVGEMHRSSPEFSQNGAPRASPGSTTSNLKMVDNNLSNTTTEQIRSPSSFECCWKSEELNVTSYPEDDDDDVLQSMRLKKSQSLGSGLDKEGRFSYDVDTEDEIDQGLSLNNSHDKNLGGVFDSFDNSDMAELCDRCGPAKNLLSQNRENVGVESSEINAGPLLHESLFSIGDLKQLDKEHYEDIGEQLSSDHVVESGHFSLNAPHSFAKSESLYSSKPSEGSPDHKFMGPRSKSVEDLCAVDARTEFLNGEEGFHSGISFHQSRATSSCRYMSQTSDTVEKGWSCEADLGDKCVLSNMIGGCKELPDQEKDCITGNENHKCENQLSDGYDSHNSSVLVNDWREPEMDGVDIGNSQLEESSVERWEDLDGKEFNIKRIQEWIRRIDIEDLSLVQELGESSSSSSIPKKKKDSHLIKGVNTAKPDAMGSPGVEAAYNYISSLTPASTSAQMANLGLVVIPFLSAFSSLRVLNLSGNGIVRVTAGALPRGLHMLNLSKNNISTIEGLRELTRLRVLELSYNRIFRIGHGLASCSSLKELYLAGNKISEVEGLHRLLKLNILDLCFNKISTAKCLGQLAANYGSLQTINLDGNPAQRNVGDDQLKRYLLGLLPHLVHFNRRIIRASSLKEISDRPVRSSATSHQFDRNMRSEPKRSRRGNHGAASQKFASSSSNHGRLGQAVSSSLKPSRDRDRHVRLPPAGSKAHHLPTLGSKLVSPQPVNPIRRSQSEGNL